MSTKNYDEIADLIEERAPAITMIELADRRAQSLAGNVVPLRASGRKPAIRIAAVIGAAAVVAAVVAGAFQLSGGQVRPQAAGSGQQRRVSRHQLAGVRLTAARVHQIARASGVALATDGHVIAYSSDVLGPYPDGAGTMDITFSHQDFNIVYSSPDTTMTSIERVVGGRIFLFGYAPPGQPVQWYMSTTETSGGQSVPDPRSLLAALQPTAAFEDLGPGVIGGVQVEHLRATNLAGLDPEVLSLGNSDDLPLSGLDVWVDSSGVIRLMELHCQGPSQPTGLIEINTITIRFLDIGKPETIIAPAHYGLEATYP